MAYKFNVRLLIQCLSLVSVVLVIGSIYLYVFGTERCEAKRYVEIFENEASRRVILEWVDLNLPVRVGSNETQQLSFDDLPPEYERSMSPPGFIVWNTEFPWADIWAEHDMESSPRMSLLNEKGTNEITALGVGSSRCYILIFRSGNDLSPKDFPEAVYVDDRVLIHDFSWPW